MSRPGAACPSTRWVAARRGKTSRDRADVARVASCAQRAGACSRIAVSMAVLGIEDISLEDISLEDISWDFVTKKGGWDW